MKNPLKCVIFDVDGTIFDSEKVWKEKAAEISKKYNIDIDEPLRVKLCGRSEKAAIKIMHKAFPSINAAAVRKEWRDSVVMVMRTQNIPLKKGFKSLFNFLKSHSFRLALASGNSLEGIKIYFENIGMNATETFDGIFTSQDVKRSKPSPQIYRLACKKLNVKPKDCLVIEDSPNGVKSATRAGIKTIMVPDVFPPTPYCHRHALAILPNLNEVEKFLKANFTSQQARPK